MKYYGLTIGPIGKTLADVRRTRHLWGGSYMFSFLMKRVWTELINPKNAADVEMLQPVIPPNADLKQGVGFFPDKLMFGSPSGQGGSILRNAITNAVKAIAEAGGINQAMLDAYLQTYVVEIDIEAEANIMEALNKHLEYAEQRQSYVLRPLLKMNDMLDRANGSKFYTDAGMTRRSFPSLAEIATEGLRRINPELHRQCCEQDDSNNEDNIMGNLEINFRRDFRQYHKYVAVIYADGDNVSKIINESIGRDAGAVRTFCEKQYEFADKAVKTIRAFGAAPVYAGGDDLLFFSPLAIENADSNTTFLNLLHTLDGLYRSMVSAHYPDTSISFGVSIFYYKYPLYESLQTAKFKLLEGTAKERPGKNAIALQLLKHSGRSISATIAKGSQGIPPAALNLVAAFTGPGKESFLSSLQYRLGDQSAILECILNEPNASERLDYFFKHNFNEPAHSDKGIMVDLVKNTLKALNQNATSPKEAVENTAALLRLVQFINSNSKSAPYDQLADQLATA